MKPRLFFEILLLLFVALKLTGQIAWSWTWVLAPFWIPLAIGILALFARALLRWRESPEERACREAADAVDALRDALRGARGR